MNLFSLASKYAAPAIAAVLLAVVSGLYVRGNVLETQRDSARIERDNLKAVVTGLQDQAKQDAIDLALLRQFKAAIDETAGEQDARTAATLARQGRVLSNLEQELRNARSAIDGSRAVGATLTRVLSEQRNGIATALESRARRIAGDTDGPVQPATELESGSDAATRNTRYDGQDRSGNYRHAVPVRFEPDELGRNWVDGVSELAGTVAEPEIVPEPGDGRVWVMEVHAWSTETHDQVPAFHRIGLNAVTAVFPEAMFVGPEACKLHSYHVIKDHYAAAKAVDKSLSFRSMVFCALIEPGRAEDGSPYRADWQHVSALFLNSVGEHI